MEKLSLERMAVPDRSFFYRRLAVHPILRTAKQIGFALALGAVLGLATLKLGPIMTLGAIFGLILLAVAFTNPELVILALLCLASGMLPERFNPYMKILSHGFFLTDFLLILLLLVLFTRSIVDRNFNLINSPLNWPILLFCCTVCIGVATAVVYHGISFSDTTYEARFLLYYLIFFPVVNLIRTKTQLLRLIYGIFFLGIMLALYVIIQSFQGQSSLIISTVSIDVNGLKRFSYPGFVLVYITLVVLICTMVLQEDLKSQWISFVSIVILSLGLLLTLGRNLLISFIIGLSILLFVLQKYLSRLVFLLIIFIAFSFGSLILLKISGQESLILRYLSAFSTRLSTLSSINTLSSDVNLDWRWKEIQFAWTNIIQHPIFGIGVETPYRPPFWDGDVIVSYIHNAYIYLWLKTGLLGLVTFLWLCIAFLLRGFRYWRREQNGLLRAMTLGFTLAFLSMMFSNFVAPNFVQDMGNIIYPVMLGICEVIISGNLAIHTTKEGVS